MTKSLKPLTKKVFRGGSESGSEHYLNAIYFVDNKKTALEYANKIHNNNFVITKNINFYNPLIILEKEIGHSGLYEIFSEIFTEKHMPDIMSFPFSLTDNHRIKIIQFALNNGYDGIVMDDTDFSDKKIITCYIEI